MTLIYFLWAMAYTASTTANFFIESNKTKEHEIL